MSSWSVWWPTQVLLLLGLPALPVEPPLARGPSKSPCGKRHGGVPAGAKAGARAWPAFLDGALGSLLVTMTGTSG